MNYSCGLVIFLSVFVTLNTLDLPNNVSVSISKGIQHNHLTVIDNGTQTDWGGGKNYTSTTTNGNSSFSTATDKEVLRERGLIFNICCGKQQKLNPENNECVDVNDTSTKKVDFLLENFVVDSNMSHALIGTTQFKYGYNWQNTCSNGTVIAFEWRINETNYNFIDQDTGKLYELNRHTKKIIATFNTEAYCLDQSVKEDSYVALVCPSIKKKCIPKCCPKGFYFNTAHNKCEQVSEGDMPKYELKVYDTKEEIKNLKDDYYVIHRQPKCQLQKFIKEVSNLRQLYVQSNGYLMVQLKKDGQYDYFENHRYCIDMFSSGNETGAFVNGLYCPSVTVDNKNISNEQNVSLPKQNNVTYGDNIQNEISFEKKLQNFSISGNRNEKSISEGIAEVSEDNGQYILSHRSSSRACHSRISLLMFVISRVLFTFISFLN